MGFELAGFVVGVIGAVWIKVAIHLFGEEKKKGIAGKTYPEWDSRSMTAFLSGICLVLLGFGIETVARLFF